MGSFYGGAGAYHITAKQPDLFAGVGVAAPAAEADAVPVERTRAWVARMKELGMQHVYVEILGGDHSLLISQDRENMQKFVDFFNIVRKQY